MPIAFLAERTTRDLSRRLGPLTVDEQTAQDMANEGQGLIIGNCDLERTIKKIAGAIVNLHPGQCIGACHSYELADRIVDACHDAGGKVLFLWGREKLPRRLGGLSAIATVPENLYRIRPVVSDKSFKPVLLFLVDPNGTTFCGRSAAEGGGKRAGNISMFRAACLASGRQVLPVAFVAVPPVAFSLDAICASLGVEALVYADGTTLRTALHAAASHDTANDDAPAEKDTAEMSPLDAPLTEARQAKARMFIHVSHDFADGATLLTELAALRGYPKLALGAFCTKTGVRLLLSSGSDRRVLRDVSDALTRKLTLINKQVIVLDEVERFYDHFGPRNALFAIGSITAPSLLAIPGPSGFSRKEIHDICCDIRDVEPDFILPSISECR